MMEGRQSHHGTVVDTCFLLLWARDLSHFEQWVLRRNDLGETRTGIILSTPLSNRPVLPPR